MLCIVQLSNAQDHFVQPTANRYRISWETVAMSTEPDLGFVGVGFDLFNFVNSSSNAYVGINSYSAMSGIRPGLITLGMSAGWCPQLFGGDFYLDLGAFVGGGGGGGADDGGGLILRPHIVLEKKIGDLGLRFGFSRIDFPSGAITGNQFNIGLSLSGANYFKKTGSSINTKQLLNPTSNKLRVAMVGTQYFNLKQGSVIYPDVTKVGLLGAQIERSINNYSYGVLKLNGALAGGTDGYMSILIGGGFTYPIIRKHLKLESRLLFGPTGGGGIESGGGATAQVEAGIAIPLPNNFDLKFMGGKTFAPWGKFNANHLEISIGKSFDRLFLKEKSYNEFSVPKEDYDINHMAFTAYNRTYLPPKRRRKDGDFYLSSFQSLGFEIQKYIGARFTINGGTVWAYQGDYGAYAEGLIGATYYQPLSSKINLTFRGMVGAAGGGAINLGSGLLFEYSVGIAHKLNSKWDMFLDLGKTQPLEGNFTPFSIDLGLKVHINQLVKKSK
ncbi:MAG: hypothetical protein ACPH2K_04940 [Flavicella sp.]